MRRLTEELGLLPPRPLGGLELGGHVSELVHPAALRRHPRPEPGDRLAQTRVAVGDDLLQRPTAQPAAHGPRRNLHPVSSAPTLAR